MAKKKRASGAKKGPNPDNAVWRMLCQCIAEICNYQPWEGLPEDAHIVYCPRSGSDPVFFCFDEDEDSFGIVIFPTTRDYALSTLDCSERESFRNFLESHVYHVELLNKDDVPPDQMQVYRRLSIDFGDGSWPSFSEKHRGFRTVLPEGEHLSDLLDYLGNLHMELKALFEYDMLNSLDEKSMIFRYYSGQGTTWNNIIAPFTFPEPEIPHYTFLPDSPILRELKKTAYSEQAPRMEFDYGWAPAFPDEDEGVYDVAIVVVITNRQTGEVLASDHCSADDLLLCAVRTFHSVCRSYGRPQALYFCRPESAALLDDLAQKADIRVKQVKRLPAAGRALRAEGAI